MTPPPHDGRGLRPLDVDHPAGVFTEPQQVDVTIGGQPVDHLTLNAGDHTLKKIALKAAQFGSEDTVEMQIAVDKTQVLVGVVSNATLSIEVFGENDGYVVERVVALDEKAHL